MAQTRSFWKNGVMGFYDETGNPDYRTGVWADCPLLAIEADPSLAYNYFEDFTNFQPITDANPPTLAGFTCTQEANSLGLLRIITGAGGILEVDSESTTHDDALQIQQAVAHFKCAADKDLWFEARVRVEDTFDQAQTFVGLCTLEATLMPAGIMDHTNCDYIGFNVETTLAGVNSFRICKDATELADSMGATGTFEEKAWMRLGFHVDGTTGIHAFIDGDEQTLTNVLYTGIPTSDALSITFVCGCDDSAGVDPLMNIDWVRCVQLR